ncbi:MAG TPA: trehalose-phosphatase [Geminicoccaceae bacterium]|nr:trehalose-phosphatase [Geminicoccus sp.]HMU51323.1 trehalose-phosphatase [Geminicoccaceae bacterium]
MAGGTRPALFLDFDGTLVELAPEPDAVRPAPGLVPLLASLSQLLGGRLAIVTGRRVAVIDHYLAPLRLSVAGLHGFEMRLDGEMAPSLACAAELAEARPRLAAFERSWPGLRLEDKGLTLALHYREAPEAEPAVKALTGAIRDASAGGLKLIHGKMVDELLPVGRDKGRAIADLMARSPFTGALPVFFGDDVTDEAGFRVVNAAGGATARVGAPRPTAARLAFAGVAAVLDWLERLHEVLSGATTERGGL